MADSLQPLPVVCARLGGCHRATVYRLVQDGWLAPPVKIGTRSAWPESEVSDLIERLKAGRNAGQNAGKRAKAA